MESERRGPSVRRFQAALRRGSKIQSFGSFATKEERDERVKQAREDVSAGRDPGALSEWDGTSDGRGEIDDPWLPPTRQTTGERRLCAAVLLQTHRDLRSPL